MKRTFSIVWFVLCTIGFSFPQTAADFYNKGVHASKNDRLEEAVSLFTKAIELDPTLLPPYYTRGNDRIYLGHYQEAIEDFNKAIELDPTDPKFYLGRGFAKAQLSYDRDAIEDYTKAIELGRNDVVVYYNRGLAKDNLSLYQDAIDDYTKAIQDDPTHVLSYINRGTCHYNMGRPQTALADFNKALELDPANESAQRNRQIVLRQLSFRPSSTPFGRENPAPSSSPSNSSNPSPTPQTHIVSVGIASYENPILTPLRAPAEQAYQLALLSQTSRFVNQEIEPLTNSKATRSSILSAIQKRLCDPNQVGPNDLVIFYYSGHGTAIGSRIGLCPYDYYDQSQLISDQEIIRLMESSPARHKVCIIEACKSEILPMSMGAPLSSADIQNFHQSRQSISGGLVFITSTEVGKQSIEFPDKGGIFSYYFLKGIKGAANQNADKQITSRELFDYLKTNVSRETGGQQIPQINTEGYRLNVPIIQLK